MRPARRPQRREVAPVRRGRMQRLARGDGGYLILLTAVAMLPIIVFVSFSVDVGAWYARASKLQRTADAAALAGVVWMPDLAKATTVALDTATKNGVPNGGNITITVSPVTGDPHVLNVKISDAKAPQFFSKMIMGPLRINRQATARYEEPIPLGSPTNYFGTGDLNSGAAAENIWAAVSGYCSAKENGDRHLARYDNAYSGNGYTCSTASGTIENDDYDPTGYLFEVKMPKTNVPASVQVQVYDGAYNSSTDPDSALVNSNKVDTTYVLYDKGSASTPLANTVLATTTAVANDSSFKETWKSIGTISNPCAGCVYYVQVYTKAGQTSSAASNGFALRAVNNGTFSACSTITGSTTPPYAASCVQLYPRDDMSVFANLSGTTATFYLASIDSSYAGRQLSISLFDSGEGATKLEILDPNGNVVNFSWVTDCNPPTAATGGCSANNVNSLNPGVQNAAQPYTRISSSYIYNDRTMTLYLTLPSDYATKYGTKTWWRIRYTVGSSASDRTTWSAAVHGAPVHLIEDQ